MCCTAHVGIRPVVAAAVVVAGLGVAASAPTSASSSMPASTPCYPGSLGAAFSGALALNSIDRYGCAGEYAYVWATIGSGNQEVSVTEILRFDPSVARWRFASRERVCRTSELPGLVDAGGCHSN